MILDEVLQKMASARTLSECEAAWAARAAYLQAHPEDSDILVEEGESLYMLEQALKAEAAKREIPVGRSS